ncbi:MAG: 4-hydroxy-tetrahydrodipicolinate reductase [Candidatus Cloacimonetes bacterium]|nr:4-hydroxy-tetrahydrodipicolinate reductase [Candidatus Cloacimonadota bacterium]
MTKVALIGYGKMGRMVHSLAEQYHCRISAIIDTASNAYPHQITAESIGDTEVCIDFTHPTAVIDNLTKIAALNRAVVIGTTGWLDRIDEVREIITRHDGALLWGANFSIGMNLFSRIVTAAAEAFDRFDDYDVFGYELHHRHKADSPSGTAIELSRILLEKIQRKTQAQYDRSEKKIQPEELHFASIRAGSIPGTHTVGFDSEADSIELIHRVRSRSCFAAGALQAARWLADRKGIYSFQDMIKEILC